MSKIPYGSYSKREFVVLLKSLGFSPDRCSKHLIFSNGSMSIPIPKGNDMNHMIARRLIKKLNSELALDTGASSCLILEGL